MVLSARQFAARVRNLLQGYAHRLLPAVPKYQRHNSSGGGGGSGTDQYLELILYVYIKLQNLHK
jgi:hypothetical protein